VPTRRWPPDRAGLLDPGLLEVSDLGQELVGVVRDLEEPLLQLPLDHDVARALAGAVGKDLFVGQGHVMDNIELTQPNLKHLERCLLMRNVTGSFQDVTQQSGEALLAPRPARGVAFGDLDNDGFVDLAINCNNQPAVILRNQGGNGNHWLSINTVGASSNRDGIGARIRVVGESGLQQWAMVSTASSYLSANDKRAHFGLGKDKMARLVEVAWPSGAVQRMESVKADQILTIRETNERRDHAAR